MFLISFDPLKPILEREISIKEKSPADTIFTHHFTTLQNQQNSKIKFIASGIIKRGVPMRQEAAADATRE